MRNPSRSLFVLGLLIVSILVGTAPAFSGERTRAERIQELLEVTGAGDLGVQVMQHMIGSMKPLLPQVPAEWWEGFMAQVDAQDLTALVIPIYENNYSDEELDAMLVFYRSPVGRSIIAKMPAVMQQSMAQGQAWGQGIANKLLERLVADGYKLPAGLQS